jgi:predicted RNA binding protein YcfA (HicA-like mRNA interferase family)
MTFRELEKILTSKGWYYHHTNGSHYIYKNKEIKRLFNSTKS